MLMWQEHSNHLRFLPYSQLKLILPSIEGTVRMEQGTHQPSRSTGNPEQLEFDGCGNCIPSLSNIITHGSKVTKKTVRHPTLHPLFIISMSVQSPTIRSILLVLCLLFMANCGRIYSGDLAVDYANAGKMTQLSFTFMLSNSINSDDYLKVALPFPFHSQLTPAVPAMEGLSSPSLLTVTYQAIDPVLQTLGTAYNTFVLTETIDSSNYYIRFYDSTSLNLVAVPAGQWYNITFKILDSTALQYQMGSSILQIQMSTVSSVWTNAMVYDDNLAFQYFELANSPANLITLAVTPSNYGGANGYLKTQVSYTLLLDSTLNIPSYQFTQPMVLKFLFSDNRFQWSGSTCVSVAKTTSPTISALDGTLYSCSIDTTNNILLVSLTPAALNLQTIFRFSVGVVNPAVVVSSVNVEVRAMKTTESTILGYGLVSSALATNAIYVTYHEIFLGWGLRPDALLPFQANVYRGNSATPTYQPYNSLSVKFSISQSTSSTLELKVVIAIPSETNAFVLSNGFTHNLPAFTNKVVVCQTEFASNSTNRSIGCTGVGQLLASTVYTVGWKMFFPYDNYNSSINCTQFGTVKVLSMQVITNIDNAFYLGRGDRYLSYLKGLSSVKVIGRNSSYITYMQTFFNLNLIVRSKDFQEFLQTPESIFLTNRPKSYSNKLDGYDDVYVVSQNLAFLTYIGLFNDIYIAARLKASSDIVKGYDSTPLVSLSVPKNTLTITTRNSMDWTDYTTPSPLVSSDMSGTQTITSTGGLLLGGATSQSIIFNFKALYSDITSFASASNTNLTNYGGLMIMMNPLISVPGGSTVTLKQAVANHASVNVRGYTLSTASAYNNYTYLEFSASKSDGLFSTFVPTTAAKKAFSFYPLKLNDYSSVYSDSNCMDFYMAAADGISGPLNKLVYNSYFLINGFTQTTSPMATITTAFVNYLASSTAPLDGSMVPTFLKITGSVPAGQATSLSKIAIFFDNLTPFFSNVYSQEVYCYGTDAAMMGLCDYRQGSGTTSDKYNYNTLSRIEIPVLAPTTTFTIYIPVSIPTSKTVCYTYFGAFYTNTNAAFSNFPILKYITTMQTSTTYALNPVISSSGTFGPNVNNTISGAVVGASKSNMVLMAKYSGGAVTANTGVNQGAHFTYFSKWDLFQGSTLSGWPLTGTCNLISYLYYYTNYAAYLASGTTFSYSYQNMTGVVCSLNATGSISTATITVSTGYLPSAWGTVIPGYGAYSTNTGQLIVLAASAENIGTMPSIMTSITFPVMGPSMIKTINYWDILLPVPITNNILLTIASPNPAINLPFDANPSTTGTCAVYTRTTNTGTPYSLPITCGFVTNYISISYTLGIKEALLAAGQYLMIYHFGMTTTGTGQVNVSITCYSLASTIAPGAADMIFQTTNAGLYWTWNPATYAGPTTLVLSNYATETLNKGVVSPFTLSFTLTNKGLYNTERIRINLGQYSNDNTGSALNPTCVVLQYSPTGAASFSHDFAAIDYSQGYSKVELWPKYHLFNSTLSYTVKCYNFLTTSSPSPISISALVVNTSIDMTGYAPTTTSITLASLTALGATSQGALSKNFLTPSALMEMSFAFSSIGIDTNTILFIGFPMYYANGLGPDIKCYVGSTEIYCSVVDRLLTVKYIGTYAAGVSFTVIVVGVSQPINYNSGTFYYKMDLNNNMTYVNVAGTFSDTVSSTVLQIQNFPTIRVVQFTQSSNLIRDTGTTLTFQFYLASSLSTITVGQQIILTFPPLFSDVLRFANPTCTLTLTSNVLKNYINTCSVMGIRIKMPLIDTLVLGSSYILTVSGLINPTAMSPNYSKYEISVADSSNSNIVLKSFSSLCNYIMPIFVTDINKVYLNYYDNASPNVITNVVNTYAGVQSAPIYISPNTPVTSSAYNRNLYFTSSSASVLTQPASVTFLSGSNPTGITLSALTNGVQYVYMTKSGDGSYYSNLPPLTVITDLNYQQQMSLVSSSYSLPAGAVGTNYSIIVSLPLALYPMTNINMTVTILLGRGLSLQRDPTIITFYPGQISASIPLYIDDVILWVAGQTTTLTLTPASTYLNTATVTLTCVASQVGAPTATITPISAVTQKKFYTFNVQCTQFGYFIYHVQRTFTYNTTSCTLTLQQIRNYALASSTSGLRVTQTYYSCQDQFGVLNIPATGTNTLLTINNLDTTTDYKITGFCENQMSVDSTLVSTAFSTVSNTGSITEATFTFASPLTVQQKIKLTCYLALQFNINYQKVATYDGYYCSELLSRRRRRLLQQQEPAVGTAVDFRNVIVYFGISNNLNTDGSAALITAATAAANTTLKTNINTNIVGMASLTSITPSSAAYIGTANQITNTPFVDVGPNYVYIYGMRLPNNGLIYVIIGDTTLWSRDPLISEIKQGSGPNGLPAQYFQVLAYRTADPMSGYFAYTNLPQGTFNLYVVCSDENPFDTAHFSSITTYPLKNEVPTWAMRLLGASLLAVLLLLA